MRRLEEQNGCNPYLVHLLLSLISYWDPVFFYSLRQELPDVAKWLGAFLALGSAAAVGVQTYFNFHRAFEAHRRIANQYSALGRESERFLSMYTDGLIRLEDLSEKAGSLLATYKQDQR